MFNPTAWFQRPGYVSAVRESIELMDILECLRVEPGPVTDRGHHIADVDEVETRGGEGPIELAVIDLESAVRRDEHRHGV